MRIELNAGGLSGLVAIATFENDIHALDQRIEDMIDSFQTVQDAVGDLPGGVGPLEGAMDALQQRIREEQQKRQNLEDFKTRFGDFLDLAVSVDRSVADLVRQNQEMFFRQNEHLRPRITIEDLRWIPGVRLFEGLMKVGEFLQEHWEIILNVTISVVIVAAGVALCVVSLGTAVPTVLVILGAGLTLGGIGFGVGGVKSYRHTGDVKWIESLKGFGFGFAAGTILGTGVYGGFLIGGLGSTAFTGAFNGVAMDFFAQTVIEGEDVRGLENYDVGRTVVKGFTGMITGMVFNGVPTAMGWDPISLGGIVLKNTVSSFGENLVGQLVDIHILKIQDGYSIDGMLLDVVIGTFFGTIGDELALKKGSNKVKISESSLPGFFCGFLNIISV